MTAGAASDSSAFSVAPEASQAQTPPRRRRWWLRLLVTVLVFAAAAGAAELILRAVIPNVIATSIRDSIGLRHDHPVEVSLHGSALLPALTGRVGSVEVLVPEVEVIDGITTDLYATAQSMPFDPTTGNIVGARGSATVASSSLDELVALVTDGLIDRGEVGDGEVSVGRTLQVFGFEIELEVSLGLSVSDGDLVVRPIALNAAGFDLSTEQLRPLLGESAAVILDEHTVCVRDRMPAGIDLTGIELRTGRIGGSATVKVDVAPDILSNPDQQEPGHC